MNPWNKTGASVTRPSLVLKLVLVAWMLSCIWAELSYSNEVRLRNERKSLPTTAGKIIQIKKENMNTGSPAVKVSFNYSVDGKDYTCEQADFIGSDYATLNDSWSGPFTIFNSPQEAEKIAADFEATRQRSVHYDPADPKKAYIDTTYAGYTNKMWGPRIGLALSIILSFVFIFLPLAGYKRGA